MDDLLFTLFSGRYDPTPPLDERQREILARRQPYDRAIHQTFGLSFVDEYHGLVGELSEYTAWLSFQAGFRLGAELMLEVLRPT